MKSYNIGININLSKDKNGNILKEIKNTIKDELPEANIIVFQDSRPLNYHEAEQLDLLLALGGDGTILNTAKYIYGSKVPVFGVNIGNLGFLSSCELKSFREYFKKWLLGNFIYRERMVLSCSVPNIGTNYTLNEVVLTRGTLSRILKFKVYVDNHFYTAYAADGIIISTPTGSTAYSMSAGGPLLYPELSNICITPICPHTHMFRSIVIDGNSTVSIKLEKTEQDVFITYDGQCSYKLQGEEDIVISRAEHNIRLVHFEELDYFSVLRNKLINKTRECAGE